MNNDDEPLDRPSCPNCLTLLPEESGACADCGFTSRPLAHLSTESSRFPATYQGRVGSHTAVVGRLILTLPFILLSIVAFEEGFDGSLGALAIGAAGVCISALFLRFIVLDIRRARAHRPVETSADTGNKPVSPR